MNAQVRSLDDGREIKQRKLRGEVRSTSSRSEPWLSKKSIAEYYDVTTTTIDTWCRAGMPFHQFGPRRRFRVAETEAWHESR